MLSRILLILELFFSVYSGFGQNVQWAYRVIEFSDEYSPIQFSAQQILGEPDVLPANEISPNAWNPGKRRKEHFIEVEFQVPISIKQIAIAEPYNVGTLKEAYSINDNNQSSLLFSIQPGIGHQRSRMFNFFVEQTDYKVQRLRLVFDGQLYGGHFYVDAVAISDSEIPVQARIKNEPRVSDNIAVEALDKNVNSPQSELRPLLSPDGLRLYFSRKNHPDNEGGRRDEEDIWYAEWNEEIRSWDPAENMGPPLNNDQKNFINSVSGYGELTLALLGNEYKNSGRTSPGISITNNTESGWSPPVRLDFANDPGLKGDFDFTLSIDRKVMLFAVARDDTNGGKDLYASFLQPSGTWSEPLNMGSNVNSVNDESSPFLDKDGRTLYFSSAGFSGYGGSDVYTSRRMDDTWQNWSAPQNMGPAINGPTDEKYFNIPARGQYAYFSRYITGGNADVFRVELPLYGEEVNYVTIKGTLKDKLTGEPVMGNVEISNSENVLFTSQFEFDAHPDSTYQISITAAGYMPFSKIIKIPMADSSSDTISIYLQKDVEVLTFENLNFASNKATLLPEAFPVLKEIIDLLNDYPHITLEVASHTDNVGTATRNMDLSKRRAETILEYLISQGNIEKERISLKWYGEAQPITSNETEDGRKKNRRVEFIIKRSN